MNNKGFTLTELTVTLALLGIMSAISIPSYFSWLPRHRLQTSVRHIYDDMNMARSRAVKTNADTYRIFIDANQDQTYDTGDDDLSTGTLENDVDITGSTFTSDTYGFNSRGMSAGTTGEVRLTNPSGLFLGVRVNTSGCLEIITSTDGGTTWG
ncbi:MAG: GspH/FimT family pseudopilin [Deltaproteobacteria bacterium]|nr:GspH/FimT family pseudopilin [Deltaproteobacteria bacterium]